MRRGRAEQRDFDGLGMAILLALVFVLVVVNVVEVLFG